MPAARRLLAALAAVALLTSTGNALLPASGPTATEHHSECGEHDCQQECPPVDCPTMSTCVKAPIAKATATYSVSRTLHHDSPADVARSTPTSRSRAPDTPPPRG